MGETLNFDIIISIRDNEMYMPRSEYQMSHGEFVPSYSPSMGPADLLTSRDWEWMKEYIDNLYNNISDEEILDLNKRKREGYLEMLLMASGLNSMRRM